MRILIFTIFLFFSSCNKEEPEQENYEIDNDNVSSDSLGLDNFVKYDTLFISARFDECGEWGGHKETLEIYSKSSEDLYLSYRKNTVDCNKIDEIYEAKLHFIKEIKLDNQNKKAINEYIFQLLQSKINEGVYAHSGKEFELMNSDSTLFISVYDNNYQNPIFYNSLLNKLNLK